MSATGTNVTLRQFSRCILLELIQIIFLSLVQGLTEFLPISSSAHLILPFSVLGWPDQGLAFDTAVHLGSLLAVLWYFRADVVQLTTGFVQQIGGTQTAHSRFANNLLIASLPLIPVGFLLKDIVETELRSVHIIIATTLIFGLLLLIADRWGKRNIVETDLSWKGALMIGVSQCFALIPGTSRSGVTMSCALFLGYSREAASRISFLLSIPAIAGASALKSWDLLTADLPIDWLSLSLGLGISFVAAYTCIRLFLAYINRIGFLPFVIYRFALAAVLFLFVTMSS